MDNDTATTADLPPPPKRPFQFGLKHLLAVPVVLAVLLGLAALTGWLCGVLLLLLCLDIAGLASRRTRAVAVIGLGLLFLAGWLCLPVFGPHPEPSSRAYCMNNLKQIALALHNYYDAYDCFPPAHVPDEKGRPMHSWRVLILPYIEERTLYEQYDFDEPWDGPNNRQLGNRRPGAFACWSQRDAPPTMTSYVTVVGRQTMWPGSESTPFEDIDDGTSDTLLVVEVVNSGVHWMEPRDLHVRQMAPVVNSQHGQGISSLHPGGACVVFANGHTQFLDEDISAEELRALLTIDGGEEIDPYGL